MPVTTRSSGLGSQLLVLLNDRATDKGAVPLTVPEIARILRATVDDITSRLWSLQKMGIITFQEHHTHQRTELSKIKFRRSKLRSFGQAEALFEMAFTTAESAQVTNAAAVRRSKLEEASRLLEEADEIELAVLALEAIEHHTKRPDYFNHLSLTPSPSIGRLIRRLSDEEAAKVQW